MKTILIYICDIRFPGHWIIAAERTMDIFDGESHASIRKEVIMVWNIVEQGHQLVME